MSRISLANAIPRCASCRNSLPSFMQARCMDCNAIVCRRSRECRMRHSALHVQAAADQAAQAMATRNLSERALHKLKKRDRLSKRRAVDPIFSGAPVSQHDIDCWNSLKAIGGIPAAEDVDTVPFKEASDAVR